MCFCCGHDNVVSVVDDLLSLVGDNSSGHYFASTQDFDLPNKLGEVVQCYVCLCIMSGPVLIRLHTFS
jgi:hypothetical protein